MQRACAASMRVHSVPAAGAEADSVVTMLVHAEEWYLKINPNGRIPTLIDHDEGDFNVWESGALQTWSQEFKFSG
jgi:glutathione S-transferase